MLKVSPLTGKLSYIFAWNLRTLHSGPPELCPSCPPHCYSAGRIGLAAWLSGSELVSVDEVTPHRARLVVGWVNPGQLSLSIPSCVGTESWGVKM